MADPVVEKFLAFVDELIPDGSTGLLSVDDVAVQLRRIRQYFVDEKIPVDNQALFAQMLIRPFLQLTGLPSAERARIKRRWSEAIGFDISLPN